MTKPEVPKGRGEWVLTSDMNTARRALVGMMKKRKLTQNALAALMAVSSTSMFSNFISGKQPNLRLDSMVKAIEAMGFEVVIREPEVGAKRRERLASLKAEMVKPADEEAGYGNLVGKDDPDRDLKLRMLGGMKEPENRASLENLFKELRESETA